MKSRRLLFIVVALFTATFAFGIQRATADVTYDQLFNALLTSSDISGSGLSFNSDTQQPLDPNLLQVIRQFINSSDGTVVADSLIASQDGSAPPDSVIGLVEDGTLLRAMASGIGADIGNFSLKGSQGVGETDQSAQFDSILNGQTYRFFGSAFTRGKVVGLVLYGAPLDVADPTTFLAFAKLQDVKVLTH